MVSFFNISSINHTSIDFHVTGTLKTMTTFFFKGKWLQTIYLGWI